MREKRKLFSSLWDLPYGNTTSHNLFDNAKNSRELVQRLVLHRKIPVHEGCVNSICWNDTGKYLLSGSDDRHLSIIDAYNHSVLTYFPTGHKSNIFSAKFLPNTSDKKVVSSSGGGVIIYTDIDYPSTSMNNKFCCHRGTAYEVMTVPNDPNSFLSCGEDKTVRWFDIRTKTSCFKDNCEEDILIKCLSPATCLAVNPYSPYQLAVGCADACARIYDRRMLCTSQSSLDCCEHYAFKALKSCHSVKNISKSHRITSLCYSSDGKEILVSYTSEYIYLFDTREGETTKPKVLNADISSTEKDYTWTPSIEGRHKLKRLRMRGDWSDTGPNARPESEASEAASDLNPRNTIVRTMSDALTRIFNSESSTFRRNNLSPPQSSIEPQMAAQTSTETSIRPKKEEISNASESAHGHPSANFNELSQPSTSRATPSSSSVLKQKDKVDKKQFSDKEKEHGVMMDTSWSNNVTDENSSLSERQQAESSENLHLAAGSSGISSMPSQVGTPSTPSVSEWFQEERNQHQQLSSSRFPDPMAPTPSEMDAAADMETTHSRSSSPEIIAVLPGSSELLIDEESDNMELVLEQSKEEELRMRRIQHERAHLANCTTSSDYSLKKDQASKDDIESTENMPTTHYRSRVLKKYTGHRNVRTMIKEARFWGDNFVMSGSDCGHIFIWDRHTGELVNLIEADHRVVNCLQPHPFDPVLASSGIDYDVKLWTPSRDEPFFDVEKANVITKRNAIMLEETKDTITVPATFMIRVFTSLNNFRSGGWREMRSAARNRSDQS